MADDVDKMVQLHNHIEEITSEFVDVQGRDDIFIDGSFTLDELKKLVELLDKELPNG